MAAILVLAVGLLAIAAMQEMALSRNVDANELSLITNLAGDMVERMRFNGANVAAYNGIDTLNVATKPPTSQPMARGDYDQWLARLTAAGLQNVQGTITVVATGPATLNQSQVTVQIRWDARQQGTKKSRTRTLVLGTIIAPP